MSSHNDIPSGDRSSLAARALMTVVPTLSRLYRTLLTVRFPRLSSVPQFRILFRLLAVPSLSLKDLAEREGVTPPTMSKSVETLLERGWLTRETDPDDRRSVRIALSDQGLALTRQVSDDLKTQLAGLLGSWDDRSLGVLIEAVELLESSELTDLESIQSLGPAPTDEASHG